jgi:uncharacterized protein YggE
MISNGMENSIERTRLLKITFVFMVILIAFFAVKTLAELRNYGASGKEPSTISLSGHGEAKAVPDIANISFSISKDAKTVKEAQNAVAEIEKNSLDFLKKNNIADKDIKTADASFYPKYEYRTIDTKPCSAYGCPPQNGNSVIVGYTASETISVKVREVDTAGAIVTGLGALKVSNLNGPNFSIDDEDTLKAEARKDAIADAKTKAEALAKDLGVRLVRITSFNESGNYPMPYYAKDAVSNSSGMAEAPRLALPAGENTITSDVSITYEIR